MQRKHHSARRGRSAEEEEGETIVGEMGEEEEEAMGRGKGNGTGGVGVECLECSSSGEPPWTALRLTHPRGASTGQTFTGMPLVVDPRKFPAR